MEAENSGVGANIGAQKQYQVINVVSCEEERVTLPVWEGGQPVGEAIKRSEERLDINGEKWTYILDVKGNEYCLMDRGMIVMNPKGRKFRIDYG